MITEEIAPDIYLNDEEIAELKYQEDINNARQREEEDEELNKALVCPFCNDGDFDKVGLKYHLENYCKEYDQTSRL